MAAKDSNHPYHLVDPSPLPLMGAAAGGLLAFGALQYMHNDIKIWLFAGLASLIFVMVLWWKDVINEAFTLKLHTPIVKIGLRYGMVLFIASEVMFFVAFFWAYFNAAFFPTEAIGGVWPPETIKTFNPFDLPFTMTLILLLSGTTVTWAHHAILEGKQKSATQALVCTVLLGILFSCFQAYEYSHAAFGFEDGIYPTTFYMATGFHGFHVIIGTIFLAVCLFRNMKGHFKPDDHFGFEAAAWYWHFVDVVWIFLFTSVYWWGSN